MEAVIQPINSHDNYDIDKACELQEGITRKIRKQYKLKQILGQDLEVYRNSSGIQSALEENPRCLELEYNNQLGFHMDIIPFVL